MICSIDDGLLSDYILHVVYSFHLQLTIYVYIVGSNPIKKHPKQKIWFRMSDLR